MSTLRGRVCVVVWAAVAVAGWSTAAGERVLLDPPPQPSGGSGQYGPAGEARWVEIEDFEPSGPPASLEQSDPLVLDDPVPGVLTPLPSIGFNGVINSPVTGTPPDTHIAVGPGIGSAGRVVMVTNGHVQIWDKTGAVVAGPTLLTTVFSANAFDPKVLYDQHSERFFMVALEGSTPNPGGLSNIRIAVSTNSTPNNLTANWTFLSGTGLTSIGGFNTWCDYPGIGADSDSLFVTANLFDNGNNFRGAKIRVFNKAAVIAGTYSFVDVDIDNAIFSCFTVQPAHVYGSTDNGGFYLISRIGSTTYRIFSITGDPGAPVVTTSVQPWAAGAFPSDTGADQGGVASPDLDTLASRIMNAVYRNGVVWLCLTSDPDLDGQTEVVWQAVATNGGPPAAPSIVQSGFINGTGGSPWTYMPSINVNAAGAVGICFTQSSAVEFPGVWYTVRLSSDPVNTFQTPVVAKAGPGYYDSFSTRNPDRWGDYSACVVDPTDESFWVANEFAWSSAVANSEWATYIARFYTGAPPHVTAVTPALVQVQHKQAALNTITITFDLDASISAGHVTVNGVNTGAHNGFAFSYNSSSKTATLLYGAGLPNDTYVVTVSDAVTAGGVPLDGEENLLSPLLPSGNGIAGGSFSGLVYRLIGDITGDRKANVFDLQSLAASWNKQLGQIGYNAACDLTGDDKVNVFDLQVLAANWNQQIPAGP